jgi:hypothetical protein
MSKNDSLPFELPKLGILDMGDGESLNLDQVFEQDYLDIRFACQALPVHIEWTNARLEECIRARFQWKHAIKRKMAEAYKRLREGEFTEKGWGVKMTETALEHAVNCDDEVQKAVDYHALYAALSVRLSNLISSLQAKLDLVRSSEATRRKGIADSDDD